jgi:hypothetical protein
MGCGRKPAFECFPFRIHSLEGGTGKATGLPSCAKGKDVQMARQGMTIFEKVDDYE